jgi:hypothetical protein
LLKEKRLVVIFGANRRETTRFELTSLEMAYWLASMYFPISS